MNEKIEIAIERLADTIEQGMDATDALKVTQAILNLANARACINHD